jgi:hypothetical protein
MCNVEVFKFKSGQIWPNLPSSSVYSSFNDIAALAKWQVGGIMAMYLWRPFTKSTAVLKLVGGSTQSGFAALSY